MIGRLTLGTVAALTVAAAGCGGAAPAPPPPAARAWFVERATETGLVFRHQNGMVGAFHEAEIFSPGVALFDFDNDGDLDAYLVQGGRLDGGAPAQRPGDTDRLFRNDLRVAADGTRTVTFHDVTADAGIPVTAYGMGVAAGDVDNDGWTDLYLTRLGRDVLLRNNGDGTFADVTARSGLGDPAWSVSASFVDIDRDGWLDLYVGNYLEYSPATDQPCTSVTGRPDYCPPAAYNAAADRLYRNRGDGTFADVTTSAGTSLEPLPALGVSTADFNGDGWPDIYVANDGTENRLWINQGDGTFRDEALLAGVALTADGDVEASMGVDAGDVDNDGDEDLIIANLTAEGQTLYLNDGRAAFEDAGVRSGIRPASLPFTGFGSAWLDADNDGWLDVLTVNGAVRVIETLAAAGSRYPLHQPPQLLRNRGNGQFEDVTARAGAFFRGSLVARGAAFGDVDNDGDTDVLVGVSNDAAALLLNEGAPANHWLGVRLAGAPGRGRAAVRDMLGARAGVVDAQGRVTWRRARSDGSFASANDPRVLFGLGPGAAPVSLRVVWPDGRAETWPVAGTDTWMTVTQGQGRADP